METEKLVEIVWVPLKRNSFDQSIIAVHKMGSAESLHFICTNRQCKNLDDNKLKMKLITAQHRMEWKMIGVTLRDGIVGQKTNRGRRYSNWH